MNNLLLSLVLVSGFDCTTDLDCKCKVVPYEAPNMSRACVEYRKEIESDQKRLEASLETSKTK